LMACVMIKKLSVYKLPHAPTLPAPRQVDLHVFCFFPKRLQRNYSLITWH
jgi:hypothetical protein